VVLVSPGDELSGPVVPAAHRQRRARLILDAYSALSLDAMAIGERDREAGVDLTRMARRALVERAGVKVGIFSVDLDDTAEMAPLLLREATGLRKRGASLVVALVHGGSQRTRALMADTRAPIDVAIASHSAFSSPLPERGGSTWVVECPPQGKQLCELDLHIVDGKLSFEDVGLRGQLSATMDDQQQELIDVGTRAQAAVGQLKEFYLQRQRQLEASLASERKQLDALPQGAGASWLENKQTPLGTEIADDPKLLELVRHYKEDVAKIPVGPPLPLVTGFAGQDACRGCHAAAVAFWKQTKHAHAMADLVAKHQDQDAACVGCHITAGLRGLPDVQCEACHGPSARHVSQPNGRGLTVRDPAEAVCRTCHTQQQSVDWQFAAFRSAILGPGHGKRR
jgi:hypothetical protein